jgi:hypothetical protein
LTPALPGFSTQTTQVILLERGSSASADGQMLRAGGKSRSLGIIAALTAPEGTLRFGSSEVILARLWAFNCSPRRRVHF